MSGAQSEKNVPPCQHRMRGGREEGGRARKHMRRIMLRALRAAFFIFWFSLNRARVCGRQQKKRRKGEIKKTLSTRWCSVRIPLSTIEPHTHATLKQCNGSYTLRAEKTLKTDIGLCKCKRVYDQIRYHFGIPLVLSVFLGYLTVYSALRGGFFLFLADSPAAYTRSAT